MSARHLRDIFILLVISAAVLLAAYNDSPWASIAPLTLFAFIVFPRWRTRFYKLLLRFLSRRP